MRDPLALDRRDIPGRIVPKLKLLTAALLVAWLVNVPAPALGASVLSDGTATPASGTTATAFSFSVHYASDSRQPAQSVWAQVGTVTVPLAKVSGTAHDGTWQGTASLPAGTWQITFHAASDPQPEPLVGPIVTVTQAPSPTPAPTPRPTPRPTAAPTPAPGPTAPRTTSPPIRAPLPPAPAPQPTPQPAEDQDADGSPRPSSSAVASGSAEPTAPDSKPAATPEADDLPAETPRASEPPADAEEDQRPRGSMLATLLFVGGTMSVAGAAVLTRQWYVSRRP